MEILNASEMRKALASLDVILPRSIRLVIGGGGAMLLAYQFPLSTTDIDAVAQGMGADELKPFIERVAHERKLPVDWLNPWFSTFTYVLSKDFEDRLINVYRGQNIIADALGREDLLLMKCFAHRQKDIAHARALVRDGANFEFVYDRIDELEKKKIPGTEAARQFMDRIIDLEKI